MANSLASSVNYIRLSELSGKINAAIDASFGRSGFWVIADITNHSFRSQKKYHYFELVEKDPDSNQLLARISGKAWGNGITRIQHFESVTGQPFTDNINVLLYVSVQYHAVYGLQLDLLDIDPNFTLGVLAQQRQATLDKLVAENPEYIKKSGDVYITKNNRLKFNPVIQRIAVISSKTSAGGEDFKHTLQHNPFGYQFYIDDYYTAVQGENNADQFLNKLLEVFYSGKPYDAVVIARGGGAQTDFLIFDNYKIGRAVARFPIPVITGIGHHKNESITDLMANTQTKTPTKAAEFIIAHNKKYADEMLSLQHNIVIKSQQLFSRHFRSLTSLNSLVVNHGRNILTGKKDELTRINRSVIHITRTVIFRKQTVLVNLSSQMLSGPKIIIYNRLNDIRQLVGSVKTFQVQYLRNKIGYLDHFRSVIKMMSPENILNKGFAIVKSRNKITSNPDDIAIGNDIDIILSGTQIKSTVKQKSRYDGSDFNL
jgi:exodeoxyribonuclease VII large subunit